MMGTHYPRAMPILRVMGANEHFIITYIQKRSKYVSILRKKKISSIKYCQKINLHLAAYSNKIKVYYVFVHSEKYFLYIHLLNSNNLC